MSDMKRGKERLTWFLMKCEKSGRSGYLRVNEKQFNSKKAIFIVYDDVNDETIGVKILTVQY